MHISTFFLIISFPYSNCFHGYDICQMWYLRHFFYLYFRNPSLLLDKAEKTPEKCYVLDTNRHGLPKKGRSENPVTINKYGWLWEH